MFSFLHNLFKKKPFGLYICDEYVQATLLNGNMKQPKIIASGQKALPAGIVQNGTIMKREELADIIKQLLAETKPQPIKVKRCILALPASQTFEHVFFLEKNLGSPQIQKFLNEELEETLPLSRGEIKYKIKIMPLTKTQIVFVCAMDINSANTYLETLKKNCNLDPEIIEPRHLGMARAVQADFTQDEGIIIVDQSETKINWVLFWKGKIFDSNAVSIEDLPEDIVASIIYFEEKSRRKVTEILVAADQEKADIIIKSLQSAVKVPITAVPEVAIATGAGLRALDRNGNQINLV
ncbi:pilus assembly protein PilM [Patescibacteria group bacterium]|nr:pilus assembly protein PilM [Patescibacteria group bacterium]MBU1703424.1 pilus assembly protein PilM [Patescibacteria group bacterium]MBU1953505.1 pilus assembly protein PilM [Patescibacteria group bacterium]